MQRDDDWRPDVEVASPDGQIDVRLGDLRRHSDESLARQVSAAARQALASLQSSRS